MAKNNKFNPANQGQNNQQYKTEFAQENGANRKAGKSNAQQSKQ